MIKIKISEILGAKKAIRRKSIVGLGLLITGILSFILVLVTVYGQYTGNYLITVTRRASLKGIAISESRDFDKDLDTLKIIPINDVEDILSSDLDVESAVNTDGQLIHDKHYIAYTFYLRNSGEEVVNLSYQVKVIDDYKHLGNAVFFKIIEFKLVGDEFEEVSDETYSKFYTGHDIIADVNIFNFKPNDKRKFTFFVWIDGDHSTKEMEGGAIKLEFNISISTAESEYEED